MIELNFSLKRKNFDVEIHESFPNGITGIYGPSGSGKTSLLQAISGLVSPQKGKIVIEQTTVFDSETGSNTAVEKRNIGYVFQEGRLFPHLNIEKNLKYGFRESSKVNFEEIVELLGLEHLLDSMPSQISGGEKQRVALGRSLLSSPKVLLLDEPFSAVDVRHREQIIPFILKIQKRVDIPILIVSHDLSDLLKLSNHLCLIKMGKVVAHGEYYDLLKESELNSFFGTSNILNSIKMKVEEVNLESGLSILSWGNSENKVQVKCEKSREYCTVGRDVKVFIQADDISLSQSRLENVSIQNQIFGKVEELVEFPTSILCIVNAGFKIVVEITHDSKNKLHLEKNSPIWCLFKSVAIDIV